MAVTLPSFAPTGQTALGVTEASSRVALPTTGTPAIALVTNVGSYPAYVLLGTSTVVATVSTGLAIMPGSSVALTIGANTHLAAIAAPAPAVLNIAVGN